MGSEMCIRDSYKRAMASGAASTRGASQPATGASPTGGASQAPSGAPLVEHAQERRQALDGEWYTMEEFRQYYQSFSAWRWHWDRAVLKVVPPGASHRRLKQPTARHKGPRFSPTTCKREILIQPNCMRCDWLGSGVDLDSQWRVVRREPVCRACNAIAPSSRAYVYDLLS